MHKENIPDLSWMKMVSALAAVGFVDIAGADQPRS